LLHRHPLLSPAGLTEMIDCLQYLVKSVIQTDHTNTGPSWNYTYTHTYTKNILHKPCLSCITWLQLTVTPRKMYDVVVMTSNSSAKMWSKTKTPAIKRIC